MSVQPRPVDTITKDNVFIGMPIVEFAPALSSGGFGAFRSLGIIDSSELQKTLETITLINASSGTQQIEREDVISVELALQVGVAKFDAPNMELFLGANPDLSSVVTAGTVNVVDEAHTVLTSDRFSGLDNRNLDATSPITGITAVQIGDGTVAGGEQVGVGDGATGTTTGDFNLDYPIKAIADVLNYFEGGVDRDLAGDLVAGTTPAAGQVAIEITPAGGVSRITYPAGEAPANGDLISVTYLPSWVVGDFTENDDFVLDPLNGGIRWLDAPTGGKKVAAAGADDSANGTGLARPGQQLLIDYDYTSVARTDLAPFTKNVSLGKARIQQLTDIGVNFIWNVTSASIRITDDAFAWDKTAFSIGTLILNILSDPATPANPFGIWQHFPETP